MGEKRLARRLVKSVDTNIVLRLLMGDEPAQSKKAKLCFDEPVLITISVLIETGWVLRSHYGLDRQQICTLFGSLDDYSTVTFEREGEVRWALSRFASGGDLADLLHVAASADTTKFVTFDRGVAPAAGSNPPGPIETLG